MRNNENNQSNVATSSIDQNNSTSGSSKDIGELLQIITERNEAVYHKPDDETTLCGIPEESKYFYFMPGDKPRSTFSHNGKEYLTVYVFVKTAADKREGGVLCA